MDQELSADYTISRRDAALIVVFALICGAGWYLYKDLRSLHNTVETNVTFFPGLAPDINISRVVSSAIYSQPVNPAIDVTLKGSQLVLTSTSNNVDQATQAQQNEAKAVVARVATLTRQAISWSAEDIKNYPTNTAAFQSFASDRLFQQENADTAVASPPLTTVTGLSRRRLLEAMFACVMGGAAMLIATSFWKFLRRHITA